MSDLLICVERKDFPADIPHPFYLTGFTPVVLCGPTELLKRRCITILNSRQSPRFSKGDAWVRKTLEALRSFDARETVLISSLGTTSWDFLSWAGNKLGFPIVLIFPAGSAQNFNIARTKAIIDLGLDEEKTLAIRPLGLGAVRKKSQANALRDIWILSLSQSLFQISIRKKGNLEGYLNSRQLAGESIDRSFATEYEAPQPIRKPQLPKKITLPEWYRPEDYLTHWTRSCVGPWPDESRAEHFERILTESDDQRGGLDTLSKIFRENVIRASGRLIRGRYPVVPFTERSPEDLPDLIRWRAGLRRWTFEPYGIALKKSGLIQMGARPVIYGDLNDFDGLSEADRPFFQIAASGKRDWRGEKEWRIQGDLELRAFQDDEIVVFVHSRGETQQIMGKDRYRLICLNVDD